MNDLTALQKAKAIKLKYVNYSRNGFDKKLFNPITNSDWIKPYGGLWACPYDTTYTWIDWCKDSDFRLEKYLTPFPFELIDSAKILTIKTVDDLELLTPYASEYFYKTDHFNESAYCSTPIKYRGIDFIKMSQDYDGMEVYPVSGSPAIYWALYGWDIDSIVLFNVNCIKQKDEHY